ncbi:MAG TPA: hypothetical protein VNO55_12895 [Polyangia bacterium]|nr:hypothetical protein [Polyangia bacterium]
MGRKITYLKFRDLADFKAHSSCPDSGGCTLGSSVETYEGFHEHELVHAYFEPLGRPPLVFVEGVAVALACQTRFFTAGATKPAVTSDELAGLGGSVGKDPGNENLYQVGAWLVGYLLSEFGPQPFLRLYRSLGPDASNAEIAATFREIYGRNLAEVWASALAEDQARNACVWACSRPPIVLDGTASDTTGICGVGNVAHPFSLPSQATIAFSTTAANVSLGPCGRTVPPATEISGAGGAVTLYHLPADAYFMATASSRGTITGIGDASATLNQDCVLVHGAGLLNQSSNYVAIPRSDATWFLALPHAAPQRPVLVTGLEPQATAALCGLCGVTCMDAGQPVDVGPDDVLTLVTDPSTPFSEFAVFFPAKAR